MLLKIKVLSSMIMVFSLLYPLFGQAEEVQGDTIYSITFENKTGVANPSLFFWSASNVPFINSLPQHVDFGKEYTLRVPRTLPYVLALSLANPACPPPPAPQKTQDSTLAFTKDNSGQLAFLGSASAYICAGKTLFLSGAQIDHPKYKVTVELR